MKNRTIREQLIIYFFLFTVLPAIAVSTLCFVFASRLIHQKTTAFASEAINQLADSLDRFLVQIETLSLSVSCNNYVQEILEGAAHGKEISRRDTFQMEKNMILAYDYASMRDVTIQAQGNTYRVPGRAESLPDGYYPPNDLKIPPHRAIWYSNPEQEVIQMVRMIESTSDFEELGTLYISVYSGYMDHLVSNINFDEKGFAIILDENCCPINLKDVEASYLEGIESYLKGGTGTFKRRIDSVDYQYFYTTSQKTGWKSVGVISLSDLNEQATLLGMFVAVCVGAVSLIAVWFSFRLSSSFSGKVRMVTEAMQKAAEGDFSQQLPEGICRNEFNDLSVGFNTMIQKITSLIQTVYQAELLKKEAQYAALQAQINPHFLYNTLDTICWQAKLNGQDEIFDSTYSLASLLRASMSGKSLFVTVREELAYVEDYLRIQKFRYRDKIRTDVSVEPELLEKQVPRLILQPIVENAFVHGLETKSGRGSLTIRGILNREEGMIVFVVKDDGVGMREEEIERVMRPEGSGKKGFGLMSVHKRIRILYGEEYGINLLSREGEGTTVVLRLPEQPGREENVCIE